ncbi:hypothetical protein Tco_1431630 [Tanacetum coccineum]
MACSLSHTDYEVEALVQKLIDEDKVRQNAILDLALQLENACTTKDDLRKLTRNADLYLTEKELHQLHLDEEALRETLEEKTMDENAREEKIRQKQAHDDEFFMEFGVVRYDSEYESSD